MSSPEQQPPPVYSISTESVDVSPPPVYTTTHTDIVVAVPPPYSDTTDAGKCQQASCRSTSRYRRYGSNTQRNVYITYVYIGNHKFCFFTEVGNWLFNDKYFFL